MQPTKSTKSAKVKGKQLNVPDLSTAIVKMFKAHPKKSYTAKQVLEKTKRD